MRSCVRPSAERTSPKPFLIVCGANATGSAANSSPYDVRQTYAESFGTRARAKPANAGSVSARVSCRARSARKFMNTTASPSAIAAGRPAASTTAVACTNSSVSPRAYAAASAACADAATCGARPSTTSSYAGATRSQRWSRSIA